MAHTSEKSRIMAVPGAWVPTSGSHAHGAREASSFSTRVIFRFLGSGSCVAWGVGCRFGGSGREKGKVKGSGIMDSDLKVRSYGYRVIGLGFRV